MKNRTATESGESIWPEIRYGLLHDVFRDPVSQAALRNHQLGVGDAETNDILLRRVRRAKVREELGLESPFRLPHLGQTELSLGSTENGEQAGIRIATLNAGLLLVGNTGASKTNWLNYELPQIAPYINGLWASDLYKQDLRHLRPAFQSVGVDLIVLRPRDLKRNILEPDCDPRTHLAVVLDLLRRVLHLPSRAMSILNAVCHQLYVQCGVYDARKDHNPVLHEVYERVRATQGLNVPARDAILDRLGALLVSLTPEVSAYRVGWKPSDLARFHIVFEMREASEHVKSLLLSDLLFSILYHRIEKGASNASLDLMIAFEDCQRFFSSASSDGSDIPPTDEAAGLIRGMGVCLLGACQSMTGLSRGLVPNLATKIMGRLGTNADYQQLGADMGMTPKQLEWARLNLKPGVFIVQLAEGRWRHPFVLKVPRVKTPSVVGDAEVANSVRALDALPTTPASEFMNWQPTHMIQIASGIGDQTILQGVNAATTDAESKFLRAVLQHPGKPSSSYARLAGMGTKHAIALRKSLVDKDYLREHTVATGGRGRNAIVLELTDKALEALGHTSQDPKNPEGVQ